MSLLHNPSHLEAINPVSQGKVRAKVGFLSSLLSPSLFLSFSLVPVSLSLSLFLSLSFPPLSPSLSLSLYIRSDLSPPFPFLTLSFSLNSKTL